MRLFSIGVVVITLSLLSINWPFGNAKKPDALLGIAPGAAIAEVRQKLGDPLMVRDMPDGSQVTWNRSPVEDAFIMLGSRDGVVTSIRVIAAHAGLVDGITDPFGVALGGSELGVRTLRGKPASIVAVGEDQVREYPGGEQLRWRYTIRQEEVHAIELTTLTELSAGAAMPHVPGGAPTLPPAKLAAARDGSSLGKAFVLHAGDEEEGRRFERFFVLTLPGCEETWSVEQQDLVASQHHHYDKLLLSCGDTGVSREAYFDITTFYGKVTPPTEEPI